jgi:UDP-2,4-diacetamido-2,4,6-trideoxy-beta-L-altropyranose hydrolase
VSNDWFVIRADAAEHIGIGHVMRCLALAEWALTLFGMRAVLASRWSNSFIEHKVKELQGKVIYIQARNSAECLRYDHSRWLDCNELDDAKIFRVELTKLMETNQLRPPKFIMVDHYALGAPWERSVGDLAEVLVVDDLSDRPHDCRWLVDSTFGKTEDDYQDLVGVKTSVMVGAKYAMLRKEFSIGGSRNPIFPLKNVQLLVTLGGVDKNNDSARILGYLLGSDLSNRLLITVVASSLNPNIKDLQSISHLHQNVNVVVDAKNMAELMRSSDVCIGAAGSTSWERCAMGLPTITVSIADNQRHIATNLELAQASVNLGRVESITAMMLVTTLAKIIDNPALFEQLSINSQALCDGLGCERILKRVVG